MRSLGRILLSFVFVLSVLLSASPARGEGGAPFDTIGTPAEAPPEGAVWDLSKPIWVFFAQERLLAPETPFGEAIPRASFAHVRPAGENGRWFFIIAGIGYLGLYHHELASWELEASLFTMLVPLGSSIYYNGRDVPEQQVDSSWADVSLRAQKTFGDTTGLRARLGVEYQYGSRDYVEGQDTDPAPQFVLPDDTSVHMYNAHASVDTRARGMTGDFVRGIELELGAIAEERVNWNSWGVNGTEFSDPDAANATTLYASFEMHNALDSERRYVLHSKVRAARGFNLDRLTYIRLGGGGFGRQFDRVGAGSTGAANDGELFRSDGVPGYFGGEFMATEYAQVNFELDLPAGQLSRRHVSAAYAAFEDATVAGGQWKQLLGFSVGFTRIYNFESAIRLDLSYSPRPEESFEDSGDLTLTYIKKF